MKGRTKREKDKTRHIQGFIADRLIMLRDLSWVLWNAAFVIYTEAVNFVLFIRPLRIRPFDVLQFRINFCNYYTSIYIYQSVSLSVCLSVRLPSSVHPPIHPSILILGGRTPWMGDEPVARPSLHTLILPLMKSSLMVLRNNGDGEQGCWCEVNMKCVSNSKSKFKSMNSKRFIASCLFHFTAEEKKGETRAKDVITLGKLRKTDARARWPTSRNFFYHSFDQFTWEDYFVSLLTLCVVSTRYILFEMFCSFSVTPKINSYGL
jgi:hypothetical protein